MSENWARLNGETVDGRFPLLQLLGAGDHSAVFLTASDEPAIQKAAIKLLQTAPGEEQLQLARWEAASRLRHPNLVRLFQMGRCELDGSWLLYLVMECADEDLAQVLPRRPLSAVEAREALEPALGALAFLHTRGFVLANLRPSNILAVADQLKLASDHLCRAGEPRQGFKELSPYDAPELARGQIAPAADVWSLGVTLVEALTQRLPVWDMTKSVEPVPPPGLPEPFAEIVRHSLQRDPGGRWSVEQIQARLGQAATEPGPAPTAAVVAPRPAAGARRRFARLATLILLLLALILVGLWVFGPRPEARPAAPTSAPAEKVQEQTAPPAEPAPEQAHPEESDVAPSAPAPAPTAPAPRPERAARRAAGSVPGAVVRQVLPDVLPTARQSIRGSVKLGVLVRVDPRGRAVEAHPAPAGPSKYFAGVAVEAARRWKFRAPRVGGRSVASHWLLRFQFDQAGTTVTPQQMAP
jgi:hypothetical protein